MITAASSTGSNAGGTFAGIVLILVGLAAYWVPTFVAMVRKIPNTGSVVVINFFLGWTVIGWVVALAMACRGQPRPQYVVPPGWVPPAAGSPGWTPPPGPQEPAGPAQWPTGPQA